MIGCRFRVVTSGIFRTSVKCFELLEMSRDDVGFSKDIASHQLELLRDPDLAVMAARGVSASVSPTAALLRASRLFAVPPPLTATTGDVSSTSNRGSDSATRPHPTHLAITTPPSSLSRGDWGLKRPLPLRSTTRSSTPLLRIESLDTLEHITEFGSAADLTLTHQKWQEMSIPISTPEIRIKESSFQSRNSVPGRSVFEEDIDVTAIDSQKLQDTDTRWKFNGPWLAGQTESEFNTYVLKVKKRKARFNQFLREKLAQQVTSKNSREATEKGDIAPPPLTAGDITNDDFQTFVRTLRQDRAELNTYIRDFLDLPPSPVPSLGDDLSTGNEGLDRFVKGVGIGNRSQKDPTVTIVAESDHIQKTQSPYAASGPPKTHPSAGLSYLRTGAHLFNHPIHGPQSSKAPVQARVLQPVNNSAGAFKTAKLGVGGIVADALTRNDFKTGSEHRQSSRFKRREPVHPISNFDPYIEGGTKMYVAPQSASITTQGSISLVIKPALPSAVAVHEGFEAEPEPQQPMVPIRGSNRVTASSDGFGLSSSNRGDDAMPFKGSRSLPFKNQGRHPSEASALLTGLLAEDRRTE